MKIYNILILFKFLIEEVTYYMAPQDLEKQVLYKL